MKEITYEDWQKNPTPRMMWVWNDDFEEREKQKVVYVIKDDFASCPVLTVSEEDASFCLYCHCAEIEEPKTRRMTNQELAFWLRDNNRREYKYADCTGGVYFEFIYDENEEGILVEEGILIRENGGKWQEPLVEYEE